MYVCTHTPSAFALLPRFSDEQARVTDGHGYRILHDRYVTLPVFTEGINTCEVRFVPAKLLCRTSWETPHSRRSLSMLLADEQFQKADDDCAARLCSEGELEEACVNSYLFFYHRAE